MSKFQIHVHPTWVQAALRCPAKLWWAQLYEVRKPVEIFGTQVHRHMENGTDYEPKKDLKEVESILPKMRQLERTLGYRVLDREVPNSWVMWETDDYEVVFSRTFDAPARLPNGDYAIIDYKSCINPWPTSLLGGVNYVPKSATLQAAGYMLPSPEPIKIGKKTFGGKKPWFDSMIFLMAPEKGDAAWYPYYHSHEDEQAFLELVKTTVDWIATMRRRGIVIRNRGDDCDSRRFYGKKIYGQRCDWFEVCNDVPGWERLVRRRK